jgi:hypothetical protein
VLSEQSSAATPFGAPGTPSVADVAAGDASAQITVQLPANDGGATINACTVTSDPGGATRVVAPSPTTTAATLSLTFDWLTNNVLYTFVAVCTNTHGASPPSPRSAVVRPTAAPQPPPPPTSVRAVAGDATAVVTFTPPVVVGDDGTLITAYVVTSIPDSVKVTLASSPATVTGLRNAYQSYVFTVSAVNAVGVGAPSLASNGVVPSGVPFLPLGVIATAANGAVVLRWALLTRSRSNGAPVVEYQITQARDGALVRALPVAELVDDDGDGEVSAVVTGLVNGQAYAFAVRAVNTNGAGAAANAPATTPRAEVSPPPQPQQVAAVAGRSAATVSFSMPDSVLFANYPGLSFVATASPGGGTTEGGASPLTVAGLTDGIAYTFTVVAKSPGGQSAASAASAAVTPTNVPGAPTVLQTIASDGMVTLTLAPPSRAGGARILWYSAVSTPGGIIVSVPAPQVGVVNFAPF